MQPIRLDGKVAIVTGAGGGIGRAYALALARRGARLVVNDLGSSLDGRGADSAVAQAVVDEIAAAGGVAVADCNDVAAEQSARAIVERAVQVFGTIDIVVCNAGIGLNSPFDQVSFDDFRRVAGMHLFGTAGVVHAAWPQFKARGYGRVVMTTSAAAMWGVQNVSGYCAGKGAVIGLMKCLAHEGAPFGIKVNAVSPGAKTRMSAHHFDGRKGWTWRPELVEPLVTYLASDQCRHNGAILSAMGGNYARVEAMQAIGQTFDARGEVSAEDIFGHLDQIDDMVGARSMVHGHDISSIVTGRKKE